MTKFNLSQLFLLCTIFCASITSYAEKQVHIFSYFTDNGKDGLHFAYSEDGYNWTALNGGKSFLAPELSKDKLMRDPCIILGSDSLYHLTWTVSWTENGIGYASSKDLIHWSAQKFLPVMIHEDSVRNCWAPEITYDAASGEYMFYWASTVSGRFAETAQASESSYNHRIYYVTTKDFEIFSPTKILYDAGFNAIDASIVKIDGKFVMFVKDETLNPPQKNIRIATSDRLTGEYSAPSAPITGKYRAEGPTAVKVGDYWVVYFDKYREHKYGAVRSKDLQTWEDVSDQISLPKGIRHGSIFQIPQSLFEKLKIEKDE